MAGSSNPNDYTKRTVTTLIAYRYIGMIKYYRKTDDNGNPVWMVASAFLEGPNVLVTAAHCCYNAKDGGWADDLYYYAARNGSNNPYASQGTVQRASIIIPTTWRTSDPHNPDYDWSVVILNNAIGNTTGYFGKKWQSGSYVNTSITMTGYPYTTELTSNVYYMYSSYGIVTSNTTYQLLSTYNSNNCASGSPVYIVQQGGHLAIGIHSGRTSDSTKARTTRFTEHLYDLLQEKLDDYINSQT